MLKLQGSSALSAFRLEQLLRRLQADRFRGRGRYRRGSFISSISAEPLDAGQEALLRELLNYGHGIWWSSGIPTMVHAGEKRAGRLP